MKELITLINDSGLSMVFNVVVIYLLVKYFNKQVDKRQCIYSSEFKEIRDLLTEVKSLFLGSLYHKYSGKDKE